jgi:hypothetical protein
MRIHLFLSPSLFLWEHLWMHMDEVLLLGRMRGVMVRFVRVERLLLVDQLLMPSPLKGPGELT